MKLKIEFNNDTSTSLEQKKIEKYPRRI